MTGRYPHANGQFGLAHLGWKLSTDEILLPAVLRNHGFYTSLIGIWHLHEWTLSAFDMLSDDVSTFDSSPEGYAEVASGRAAIWLQNEARRRQPFFLHIGFWEVHRPFCGNDVQQQTVERMDTSMIRIPDYLPSTQPARREIAELHQSVSLVDQGVGHILDALKQTGLNENTLVLFTADHGLPFPRAKGTLYDPGIHVALLVCWPGYIPVGSRCHRLTSNVDVMPTLLEAAQISCPDPVQGKSFFDQMLHGDQADDDRNAIYAEKTYHEHYDPMRCVRTANYKYIRNFADRPRLVLPSDVYNSPTRRSMTDDESIWSLRPREELYDLTIDQNETTNLALDPAYDSLRFELSQRLEQWMRGTADPLINGPIPRVQPTP